MTSHFKTTQGRIAAFATIACVALLLVAFGPFPADATSGSHFEGTVMGTGASALMIQSLPDNDTVAFRVDSKAAITKDGEKVTLDKVASGDSVTVESTAKDNERIATSITAHSPY